MSDLKDLKIRWALHRDESEPTSRQRGILIYRQLQEWGYDADRWDMRERADIIVCQYDFRDQGAALGKAKVVVQDINDFIMAPWHPCRAMFERCVGKALAVSTGTARLHEHLAKWHSFVRVIPDALEDEYYEVTPAPHDGLNILWVGFSDNIVFFDEIDPMLAKLAEEFEFTVDFITSLKDGQGKSNLRKAAAKPYPARFHEWSIPKVLEYLAVSDIAIAPLFHNEWCSCKGPNKALLFMGAGLPVVASDVTPYRGVIEHGRTGYLCMHPEDWAGALRELQGSAALRCAVGQRGRRVAGAYRARVVAKQWLDFFEEIRPR